MTDLGLAQAHPWALLATADLDALGRSWALLVDARIRVARVVLAADDGVKAWRPNPQPVSGTGAGTADPEPAAAAELDYLHALEARASEAVDQTRWIALDALGEVPDSWTGTRTALARLNANQARSCIAWLKPADAAIRRALQLVDDVTPARGNPECPACTVRLMRVRAASRLIVCTAGCRCQGDTCPCGMPVRDRGAPHIWTPGETN